MMHSSVADLTTLLDDFLSLEKVESGQMELELVPTPIRPMLQTAVAAFTAALSHRSLEVAVAVDLQVPTSVILDPHRSVCATVV